jgi:hypothetical protein
MRRAREQGQDDALFYVFNINEEDGGGFVIVSGDEAARPVLGYSPNGNFDENDLSPAFVYWMEFLGKQIEYAQDNGVEPSEEVRREWNRRRNNGTPAPAEDGGEGAAEMNNFAPAPMAVVGPLVQTHWGQGAPFNNMAPPSPAHNGQRAYTGCVATAMAQIMDFHKYPVRGAGVREAYTTQDGAISIPAVDFSTVEFDWGNMLNFYDESATAAQQNAVANLMYHAGVSIGILFASNRVGDGFGLMTPGNEFNIGRALRNFFGYSGQFQGLWRSQLSDNEWETMLIEQLDAGLPVIYTGQGDGPDKGGHAFICDGYDNTGKFHFNWGSYGRNDGFFVTTALESGGGYSWNVSQTMVINLFPANSTLDAKVLIENTPFNPVAQNNVNTQAAARAHVETIISGLDLNDVSAAVTNVNFEAAFAGTVGNPSGMDGYYTFTVSLSGGAGAGTQQVTRALTLTITATPFNSQVVADNADITAARVLIEGTPFGPVAQSSINTQAAARAHVENAIAGLNLNGVSAAVTNINFEAAFAGTTGNLLGMDGYYNFTVTLNKGDGREQVTRVLGLAVTATPHGDASMIHSAEIAAARAIIESTEWEPAPQNRVTNLFEARFYIDDILATLNLNDVSAVVASVILEPAFAGTVGNPSGMNGWYNFTVTLSKGTGTRQTTDTLELAITANHFVSVLSPDRTVPDAGVVDNVAAVVPANQLTWQFTAGPNPVPRSSNGINFFWQGGRINDAVLTIFDAGGNVVNKIRISDCSDVANDRLRQRSASPVAEPVVATPRRLVGTWNLTDRRGRTVSEGTYLLRGTVVGVDGKRERVSVVVGVR